MIFENWEDGLRQLRETGGKGWTVADVFITKYGLVTTRRMQDLERNLGIRKDEMTDMRGGSGSGMYASAVEPTQTESARGAKRGAKKSGTIFSREEMARALAALHTIADVRGNIKRNGSGKVLQATLGLSEPEARGRMKTLRHRKFVRGLRARFYGGQRKKVAVCLRLTRKGMNLIQEVCPELLPINLPALAPRKTRRVAIADQTAVTQPGTVMQVTTTTSSSAHVDDRYERVKRMAEEYERAKAMLDDPLYARAAEIVADTTYRDAVEHLRALNQLLDQWEEKTRKV